MSAPIASLRLMSQRAPGGTSPARAPAARPGLSRDASQLRNRVTRASFRFIDNLSILMMKAVVQRHPDRLTADFR